MVWKVSESSAVVTVKLVERRPNSSRTAVPSTVTPPSFTVLMPPASERTEALNQAEGGPERSAAGKAEPTFSRKSSAETVTALS